MDEAGSSISETSTLSENVTENGAQSKPTTDKDAGDGIEGWEKLLERELRRRLFFSDSAISCAIKELRKEGKREVKIEIMSLIAKIEELENEVKRLKGEEEARAMEKLALDKEMEDDIANAYTFKVSPEEWRRSFLGIR